MTSRTLAGLIICTLAMQPFATVSARDPDQDSEVTTAKKAAAIAQQRNPGKVLSVKRDNGNFRVKILNQGKINYVIVKAK